MQSNKINSEYTIILCHSPPLSISRHGDDYIIKSMLEVSKVKYNLVISGHEHCYMKFEKNNKIYLVNGLGGHSKYNFYDSSIYLKKKYNELESILYLTFNSNFLTCTLKNINNEIIDKTIIYKTII